MSYFVWNMDDKEPFSAVWKDPALDRLSQAIINRVKQVHAQREAILEAFLAETGCLPSECEQVQVTEDNTVRWFVRRRTLAFTPENDAAVDALLRPLWEPDE